MPGAGARRRRGGVAAVHGFAARGGHAANSWDGQVWPDADRPPTHNSHKEAPDSGQPRGPARGTSHNGGGSRHKLTIRHSKILRR